MEMSEEDAPPESIWLDDEALSDHFANVRDKYRGTGSQDTGGSHEPLDQNELTRGLR